jgi:hypothetical protein
VADVWVVLLIVGFFSVCVALVRGCDRIIGGDDASELDSSVAEASEREPTGVAR